MGLFRVIWGDIWVIWGHFGVCSILYGYMGFPAYMGVILGVLALYTCYLGLFRAFCTL